MNKANGNVALVLQETARAFKTDPAALLYVGDGARETEYSIPRKIAMWVLSRHYRVGTRLIARVFGRNQSTVSRSVAWVTAGIRADITLRVMVAQIEERAGVYTRKGER